VLTVGILLVVFAESGAPSQLTHVYPGRLAMVAPAGQDLFKMGSQADGQARRARQERVRRLSLERDREVLVETARLLALAADLKTEIDRGSGDRVPSVSADKADAIGKLAHSIQEKTVETFGK